MLRGINHQQIFEDIEDNEKYLEVIRDCKVVSGYKLYAYSLMGNHIHLLLKEENEGIEQIFKRIGARYVYWYNRKYKRSGHLFQDRFKSEPVEDNEYFLTVMRYIHQNPVVANLCDSIEEYRWSSYNEYKGLCKNVDPDFVFSMMSLDEFVKFNNAYNDDSCLENNAKRYWYSDDEAKEIMKSLCGCETVAAFQNFSPHDRNVYIKMLKEKRLSIRQISRLTGVSRGIVERK